MNQSHIKKFSEFTNNKKVNEMRSDTYLRAGHEAERRKETKRAKNFKEQWLKKLQEERKNMVFSFEEIDDEFIFDHFDTAMANDIFSDTEHQGILFDISFYSKNVEDSYFRWMIDIGFETGEIFVDMDEENPPEDYLKNGLEHIGQAKRLKRLFIEDIKNWNNKEFEPFKQKTIDIITKKLDPHVFIW